MSLVQSCPFCGAKETDLEFGSGEERHMKWGFIQCRQCGCRGPEAYGTYWAREEWEGKAIGEWNKRS